MLLRQIRLNVEIFKPAIVISVEIVGLVMTSLKKGGKIQTVRGQLHDFEVFLATLKWFSCKKRNQVLIK